MSKQIQAQAAKVWQTVSDPATAETYQKTGALTWTILKETGYLLWLVICLVLVVGEWFWKFSFENGQKVRGWINNLDTGEKASVDQLLSETGKNLLEASKSSMATVLATAKTQLGIEEASASTTTQSSAPAPTATPKVPAPNPPAPAPAPKATAAEPKVEPPAAKPPTSAPEE